PSSGHGPRTRDRTRRVRSDGERGMRRPHRHLFLLVFLLLALTTGVSSAGNAGRGQLAPTVIAPPTTSGAPVLGQTLASTTGSWDGVALTFSYQWRRCDTGGNACVAIPGATAGTYLLAAADVGATFRSSVTATNK